MKLANKFILFFAASCVLIPAFQNCAMPPGLAPVTDAPSNQTSSSSESSTTALQLYLYFVTGNVPENIQSIDISVSAPDLATPVQKSWVAGNGALPPLDSIIASVPKGSARLVEAHVTAVDPVSHLNVVYYGYTTMDFSLASLSIGLNLAQQ